MTEKRLPCPGAVFSCACTIQPHRFGPLALFLHFARTVAFFVHVRRSSAVSASEAVSLVTRWHNSQPLPFPGHKMTERCCRIIEWHYFRHFPGNHGHKMTEKAPRIILWHSTGQGTRQSHQTEPPARVTHRK
jgi:hypothetical protein